MSQTRIELTGAAVNFSGLCPSVNFVLGGTPVVTDAATDFDGVRCPNIADGDRLEVEGVVDADGRIVALEVELESTDDDDDDDDQGDDDADIDDDDRDGPGIDPVAFD